MTKVIVEKRIEILSKHAMVHSSAIEWFEDGLGLLKQAHEAGLPACPLCGSDLSQKMSTLIGEYDAYFNDEYRRLTETLIDLEAQQQNDLARLREQPKGLRLLGTIKERYSGQHALKTALVAGEADAVVEALSKIGKAIARKKAKMDSTSSPISKDDGILLMPA